MLEEQTHQDMQAAILSAQEEAHSRVEEGYKEASQAVSRALQELEACRKQVCEYMESAVCVAVSRRYR